MDESIIAAFSAKQGIQSLLDRRPVVVTLGPEPNMAVEQPTRTLRCRTITEGGSRHRNNIRDLPPLLVEERMGGFDDASVPSPSEALLAALGSCLSARIHANATAGSIHVHSLELNVEVDVGASLLWEPLGTPSRAVGFEAIRVVVHLASDASPEAVRALVAHAVLWSPIANTLHDPVHLDVAVKSAP